MTDITIPNTKKPYLFQMKAANSTVVMFYSINSFAKNSYLIDFNC